jgi:hypothetical protein
VPKTTSGKRSTAWFSAMHFGFFSLCIPDLCDRNYV